MSAQDEARPDTKQQTSPLVIDIGSQQTKAGFAGDDAPQAVFNTIIGTKKLSNIMHSFYSKDKYVGDEAISGSGYLSLSYPVERGVVTNWDDYEVLLHHTFYNELRMNPDEHPVLMSEPALNPKSNREKLMQIMFETFAVPATFVATKAALSLYASGRHCGVVVEYGEGAPHIVPIEGVYTYLRGIKRMNVAGGELTNYLSVLMRERGYEYDYDVGGQREIVRSIKEKVGFSFISALKL